MSSEVSGDQKESDKAIAVGNPEPDNKVYPHSTVGYSEALDVRKYKIG